MLDQGSVLAKLPLSGLFVLPYCKWLEFECMFGFVTVLKNKFGAKLYALLNVWNEDTFLSVFLNTEDIFAPGQISNSSCRTAPQTCKETAMNILLPATATFSNFYSFRVLLPFLCTSVPLFLCKVVSLVSTLAVFVLSLQFLHRDHFWLDSR